MLYIYIMRSSVERSRPVKRRRSSELLVRERVLVLQAVTSLRCAAPAPVAARPVRPGSVVRDHGVLAAVRVVRVRHVLVALVVVRRRSGEPAVMVRGDGATPVHGRGVHLRRHVVARGGRVGLEHHLLVVVVVLAAASSPAHGGGADAPRLALELAVAVEVDAERVDVVVEAEAAHGPEHVLGGDGLALLALAPLVGLPRDEADVLGHALLDRLLGVVRDLGVRRQHAPHDADHVRDRHQTVLLPDRRRLLLARLRNVVVVAVVRGAGREDGVHWLPLSRAAACGGGTVGSGGIVACLVVVLVVIEGTLNRKLRGVDHHHHE
jgi:hypothetical protein